MPCPAYFNPCHSSRFAFTQEQKVKNFIFCAIIPILPFLMAPMSLAQAEELSQEISFTIGGEAALSPRSYNQTVAVSNPVLGYSNTGSGHSDVAFRIGAVPSLIVWPNAPIGLMVSASVGFDYSSEDGIDAGDISADESTGAYANLLAGPSIRVGQRVRLSVLGTIGGSAGSTSRSG